MNATRAGAQWTEIEAKAAGRGGFYSMSALRQRGWSEKEIKTLGEEDLVAPNPRYASGHMMKLFDVARVRAAEAVMCRKTAAA